VRPAGAAASAAQAGQAELQPIGALQPGDEVLAWSEWKEPGSDPKADARLSYEKVQQVITSTREQHLVHLTLDRGETITATAGHPFRTREGWRDAVLLKKGGQLLLKGGADDGSAQWATVAEVRQETRTVQVFNLEVAKAHTFLVGKDGVVVHNAKRGPKTDPNAPHNSTIEELADLLDAEGVNILAGGRRLPEKLIPTPCGKKSGRRPDILFEDRFGNRRGINVGKNDSKGNPVPREADAINDLNGAGVPTVFVPYN
jgi:hypothetical protein